MCPIERARGLQCWVIISIKYIKIGGGGQSTCIDAKGIENALRLIARV